MSDELAEVIGFIVAVACSLDTRADVARGRKEGCIPYAHSSEISAYHSSDAKIFLPGYCWYFLTSAVRELEGHCNLEAGL